LALFDVEHQAWTVEGIVKNTGLPRPTVYRLLETLEKESFVLLDKPSGTYHLGYAMLASLYLVDHHEELVTFARPYIEKLAAETGETVCLWVEIGEAAVLIDSICTSRPFRPNIPIGRAFVDVANCNSKLFVAYKPEAEIQRILRQRCHKWTPQTTTDVESLFLELQRAKQDGVAYDMQERFPGVCAVGAPIFDLYDDVAAVLSLPAPPGRFGPDEMARYTQAVRNTAASISAFLGYSAG